MDEFLAIVNQFGPAAGGFLLIAGGFWMQSRSLNAIVASTSNSNNAMSEIATTSTAELRERNDRIGTLEASLLAERDANHQKTLRIVELEGVLNTTTNTLGHREFELNEAREANSALRAAREELDIQFSTLKTDVGNVTSRLKELESKLTQEQEHSTSLGKRLDEMEADLAEARTLREEAENLNRELTAERDRLVADNQAQAELIEQYTMRLAGFEEENRLLKERLTELELKIERMNHVDENDEMVSDVGGAGDATGADGSDGAG